MNTAPSPTPAAAPHDPTPPNPSPQWNTATEANPEHGYRDLTHVDFHRQTLHISGQVSHTASGPVQRPTKTHAERRLTLDSVTLAALGGLRGSLPDVEADRYIFSHEPAGGTPWRPDYTTLAFARLAGQLGIAKIRLHDLPHFAATTMLLNGVDVRTAAGRLGHARASTTLDIYAHFTQPADQRASDTLADSLNVRG